MGMLIQNAQEQQDRLYFMQQIEYNQNGGFPENLSESLTEI